MSTDKNPTRKQIAEDWAKITVKVWRSNLVKLKAVRSNRLWQSFVADVISKADGDPVKVKFAFLYYGKFVDMGVGRGTKIGGVKENTTSRRLNGKMLGNRRKPRKWYNKALTHESYRLAELLGQSYASTIATEIVSGIENAADNSIAGGARKRII